MAFDIATATPVTDAPPSAPSGFDLSTAKPVAPEAPSTATQRAIGWGGGIAENIFPMLESMYGVPAAKIAKFMAQAGNDLLGPSKEYSAAMTASGQPAPTQPFDPEGTETAVRNFFVSQPQSPEGQAVAGTVAAPFQGIQGAADKVEAALPAPVQSGLDTLGGVTGDVVGAMPIGGGSGSMETNAVGSTIAAPEIANAATAEAAKQSLNAPRDAILAQGRARGLVAPPTAINPGMAANAAESISGKAATRQAMQARNAEGFNAIIRDDLGLPKDQPLTRDALKAEIKDAGKVYGQVQQAGPITHDDIYNADLDRILQIGPDLESAYPGSGAQANEKVTAMVDSLRQPQVSAKDAIGMFKFLNNSAKDNFTAGFAGDPQALQLARGQRAAADAVSDLIHRNLESSGNKALADAWDDASTRIAKNYTALGALKGNDINALNLAAQMRRDKPLSGGFKLVADFADQFPEVSAVPKSGAGVSKLAALVAGEGVGGALLGHPILAATAAAGTVAPYLIRKFMLSDSGQGMLGAPSYDQRLLDLAAKYRSEPPLVQPPKAVPALPAPATVNAGAGATTESNLAAMGLTPDVQRAAVSHPGAPADVMRPPNAGLLPAPGDVAIPLSNDDIAVQHQIAALRESMARAGLTPDVAAAAQSHPGFARPPAPRVPLALPAPGASAIQLPDADAVLARLHHQYGLTPDVEAAMAAHPGRARPAASLAAEDHAEAALRQALESQAGYARGGYASELSLLRRSAQNR